MTQAVILAGGIGTRLASVSGGVPKPLVPIDGIPIVVRQIQLLARYDVREIFLTTGFRAEALEDRLGDGSEFGVKLHYVREKTPLGTAGGVAAFREQLVGDFFVLYGDVMVWMDLSRLLRSHRAASADVTIVVHPNDHPYDSDLVVLGEEGRIRSFLSKPRPMNMGEIPNMVSAALYVLSSSATRFIEPNLKQDFVRDVFPSMLASNARLFGYHSTEYLKDMGTPERLEQVQADLRSGLVERMHASHKRPTVFFDRDGVVNHEIDGVYKPEDLELIPGAGAAIRALNRAGWLAVIITNQPAIAKGFMSERDLERVHWRLETLLGEKGAWVDAILHCPHHPDSGFQGERKELKVVCSCRKPGSGMLDKAGEILPTDPTQAVMVGDSWRDMAAAHCFGVDGIGVFTGHAMSQPPPLNYWLGGRPDVVVKDLSEAVSLILSEDPDVQKVIDRVSEAAARRQAEPVLVLIGGLSRAGKSAVTFSLRRRLRERGINALWVRLDDWLVPASLRPRHSTVLQRYEMKEIRKAIESLMRGERVIAPGYDSLTRERAPVQVPYDPLPADVVMVEGVPALAHDMEPLKPLRVHVEAPSEGERNDRLVHFYRYKGFTKDEIAALLLSRAEEVETVSKLVKPFDMRVSLKLLTIDRQMES